ncbi:non-ribosomal peptide synthetase [Nocardia sp. alder85J]|uniref:non-ribosomal peptide synthetase n=1 Tax=Nocardia sp. alder85J TaxID=2862949 RepID=UPI001CD70F33|nr:non-ribosomal peptide synthetase [Nocardia sp. alder85J]MCX4093132.1 non-ribosomal peptide synthetase [Nocardia sp. alder85J]
MSDSDATEAGVSTLDRRMALLRRRMREQGLAEAGPAETPRVRAGERRPLSAGQQRLWFLQTWDPEDTTLNLCVAYRLTGPLDAQRLHAAVRSVVARHAILRTGYGLDDAGEPYQVFSDDATVAWQVHDLSALGEDDRTRRVAVLARREFGHPFDLGIDAPLRLSLIRVGVEEHVLVFVAHHICWDDDSWPVFFAGLNAAYRGEQPDSGTAPVQFVDLAIDPEVADESDLDYWRTALPPIPAALELPGPPVLAPSTQAQRHAFRLPDGLLGRVDTFARAHGASRFMVLLAGFGALIHRYTAATDFLVSVPITERRGADAEALIGYFGNTLLIRQTVAPQDDFDALVEATRQVCLGAFAHQRLGIDRVVRELNPQRLGGRDGAERLVRLGFSVRRDAAGFDLPGVRAEVIDLGAPTAAQLPLALTVASDAAGDLVEAEYWVDRFGVDLIEQLLAHYVHLLESALAEPARPVCALDLLGDGRGTVLARSHGPLVDSPAATLVDLVQARVTAAPDALALVSDQESLTYAQWNGRSNRLAHWLIGSGIGPEDIVALRLSASVEFLVAATAVLKAGAAYLPIDPAHPADRIGYMIEDAGPALVLGADELRAAEQAAADRPDTDPADADRVRPLLPGHLAYVIYTSGSTGMPKGVPVAHHAIAEHISTFSAEWGVTPDERCLQTASVSFDASLGDIFVTLTVGGCLVIPKPGALGDIRYIADLITTHGVTGMQMVPSMLSTLLLLPEVSRWRSLRRVPVGGEALPGEVADRFAKVFDAELRNHYGPTEAVVCATHMQVSGPQGGVIVPIGVPNANVHVYLLDQSLQLVPDGVVGEIYLGGTQLARGYLGRAGLSAQRFVADPFTPGVRLYRTGDLARRNARGEIEFIGRADEQVKVRGFRIELGEIESALATHPRVAQGVVTVVDDPVTGPALAAYVVGAEAAAVDPEDVRAHVGATLPEYMVPATVTVIDRIPVTVNGKLDKRALPDPAPVARREYREPATETERRICAIFAALFDLDRVGTDDSFFELGGHSLLAARLTARIRADLGVELPVRTIFDTPTPGGLATRLDSDPARDPVGAGDESAHRIRATRPPVTERQRPERIPLSYAQLPMWYQYRLAGPGKLGNIPFSVRLEGPLDTAALAAAVADVVARHESLRTVFPEDGGIPYQFVHPTLEVPLPITRIAPEQLDVAMAERADHPFVLDREALIRTELFALGGDVHVLSMVAHHIVIDHGSLSILLMDLVAAYRARIGAVAPQRPVLPIQYSDYALWQRDVFDPDGDGLPAGAYGRDLVGYWRTALAGLPEEVSVGHDRPRPALLGKRGVTAVRGVAAQLRSGLVTLAEQSGASEFMLYQAALATLLHRLGGGPDIPIGTPMSGRVDEAVTDLVGLFANMVVLRNDLSGEPTLREMVGRGRDVVLDAHTCQELPVQRLIEVLDPLRSSSRQMLYQTMIQFRGADWAPESVDLDGTGDTTLIPLQVTLDTALVDLSVSLDVRTDGGLDVLVVANADLYEPDTAGVLADALVDVLTAFATAPDRRVADLEVLDPVRLERLLAPPVPAAPVERSSTATGSGGETERRLIALLEELLDVTDVGPEDGFFALGGDSVICVQWSSRAAERGLALTPQMVFEYATIAELAAAVDAESAQATGPAETPPDQHHEAMSVSGLDAAALAALESDWEDR